MRWLCSSDKTMIELHGKRVLVMGLGLHGGGLGVARWLVRQGAVVTITDLKKAEALEPSIRALNGLPVRLVLGEHRAEDFANCDLVIRNPGVPRESPFLQVAQEHGVPIDMEMGLFFDRLPRGGAQVIGITGTKGKTTTTSMVGTILKRVNPKTVVAGNLRVSALDLLEQIDADTPVVLELSSWQLEGLAGHKMNPHLSAVTNIYPDHLNRYRDLEDYAQAKAEIFRYQLPSDYVVLNRDNPLLTRLAAQAVSRVVWTSSKQTLDEGATRDGCLLCWNWGGRSHRIIATSELHVAGEHNIENALAAIAVSLLAGAAPDQVAAALAQFKGVEHRQELVREIDGVRYINDTTATAPAATIAALESLAPNAREVVLIAGGSDKGLDFDDLSRAIARRVKYLILLEGSATDRLAEAVGSAGATPRVAGRYNDLTEAVERARQLAQPGDLVLLSPGCASFGMFANEFERGEQFRRIVNRIDA